MQIRTNDTIARMFTDQLFPLCYQSQSQLFTCYLPNSSHLNATIFVSVSLWGLTNLPHVEHLVCTHHNRHRSCSHLLGSPHYATTWLNDNFQCQNSIVEAWGPWTFADRSKMWAFAESPLRPARPHNWKVIRTMLLRTALRCMKIKAWLLELPQNFSWILSVIFLVMFTKLF